MSKHFSFQGVIVSALLTLVTSAAAPASAQEWQFSTLHSFGIPALSAHNAYDLTLGNDGKLYGTCGAGGAGGGGIVFRMDRDGSNFESIHDFSDSTNSSEGYFPAGGVLLARDGRLYGTAWAGGDYTNFWGTIYTLNPDGTDFRIIYHFVSSEGPGATGRGLLEGTDGKLYGITSYGGKFGSGSIFGINKDGTGYEITHEFDGSVEEGGFPFAPLLLGSDGMLYGETSGNWDTGPGQGPGTIFKLNPDGTGFQVIHTVNASEGTIFDFRLTEGRDGALYGTTYVLEIDNGGVIFKVHKNGTGYRVVHEFSLKSLSAADVPFGPLYSDANGLLYGVTRFGGPGRGAWGTLFALDENGNSFRVLDSLGPGPRDARFAIGALVPDEEGNFFGESQFGGLAGEGTILRYSGTHGHEILHSFNSTGGDGALPNSRLSAGTNGVLYGTTFQGGQFGKGTLYQMNSDGSGYKIVRNLSNQPIAAVADPTNGNLYLTTQGPGGPGDGFLYQINPEGKMRVLHYFRLGTKYGTEPGAPLVTSDGRLYGIASTAGLKGVDFIYRIDKDGKDFQIIYQFNSVSDSDYPPLMEGSDGALYGIRRVSWPPSTPGIAFKIGKNGTGFTILHTFNSFDPGGTIPTGPFLEASDGMLYGTTENSPSPIAYRMDKYGNNFQVLYTFSGYNGPVTGLAEGGDGAVYGLTSGGLYGLDSPNGSVFRLQEADLAFNIIANFEPTDTAVGLVKLPNGTLYGTLTEGGNMNIGRVFELTPP